MATERFKTQQKNYSMSIGPQAQEQGAANLPRLNLEYRVTSVTFQPHDITVTTLGPKSGERRQMVLVRDDKHALDLLTAFSMEQMTRFKDPWFTRKELMGHDSPQFTIDRLTTHLQRLRSAGILEMNSAKGHRLLVSPDTIQSLLTTRRDTITLEATAFDTWFPRDNPGYPLFTPSQISTLQWLHTAFSPDSPPEQPIKVEYFRLAPQSGRVTFYSHFRKFATDGIIGRAGMSYQAGDINFPRLRTIVEAQKKPIILDRSFGNVAATDTIIYDPRAHTTPVASPIVAEEPETETVFTPSSWRVSGINVLMFDPSDAGALALLKAVCTSDLKKINIQDPTNKSPIYKGRFPFPLDSDKSVVLGLFEFLNIGPRELEVILKNKNFQTLAASLRANELSLYASDPEMTALIKSRLASLIFGENVSLEEAQAFTFPELLVAFEDKISQGETVIYENKMKLPPSVVDKTLISFLRNILATEIRRVIHTEYLPPGLILPVMAMKFHPILSIKGDIIPWRDLLSLKLASESERDHHDLYTPEGALVAALYMNDAIQSRSRVGGSGAYDGIRKVATHTYHLLQALLNSLEESQADSKLATYLKNCIDGLKQQSLMCICPSCTGNLR